MRMQEEPSVKGEELSLMVLVVVFVAKQLRLIGPCSCPRSTMEFLMIRKRARPSLDLANWKPSNSLVENIINQEESAMAVLFALSTDRMLLNATRLVNLPVYLQHSLTIFGYSTFAPTMYGQSNGQTTPHRRWSPQYPHNNSIHTHTRPLWISFPFL